VGRRPRKVDQGMDFTCAAILRGSSVQTVTKAGNDVSTAFVLSKLVMALRKGIELEPRFAPEGAVISFPNSCRDDRINVTRPWPSVALARRMELPGILESKRMTSPLIWVSVNMFQGFAIDAP